MPNTTLTALAAGTIQVGSLLVNRIGLGTNRIKDNAGAHELLHRAVALGVNFIDTADMYQRHESESTIGHMLAPYPNGLVIATKGGMHPMDYSVQNDPAYLRNAVEGSLERLKVSRIDLYQLHRIDKAIPIENTVGCLKRMQDEGKIRHIGLSDVTVEQIERARKVAEIVSIQNEYNLLQRKHESVVEYCELNGLAFIPWYPIVKGKPGEGVIERIAAVHKVTTVQIAIAWLLQRSPAMLPIPGTLSIEHLEANIAAASIQLTPDEFAELSRI